MRLIDFDTLFQSGGYSIPVLVELSHPDKVSWYFTNNSRDIIWDGQLYKSVTMSYKSPSSKDGMPTGGTLEIDIDIHDDYGYELLAWFEEATDKAEAIVVATISEGEVRPIGHLRHHHGTVSWDGKKIVWNIGWDDRLQMQINPVNFDNDALTG
jgi:hypothetical protein